MLRQINYHDAWSEEQGSLQAQSSLVVQEMLPPVRYYKFWQDNAQGIMWVAFVNSVDISQQGTDERAILPALLTYPCSLAVFSPLR